jgi:hypothetical protein
VLEPQSKGLSDLVIQTDITDASLPAKAISETKKLLAYDLAPVFQEQSPVSNWEMFQGDRTNAFIQTVIEIHAEAVELLKTIPGLSKDNILKALDNYFNSYPDKNSLLNSTSLSNDIEYQQYFGEGHTGTKMIDADIDFISRYLDLALHSATEKDRVTAFQRLRKNTLFQHIGPGFIVYILGAYHGQTPLLDLVTVRITMGSAEGASIPYVYGSRKAPDENYKSVQYMLGLINDRSFDLRVQMDGLTGKYVPYRNAGDNERGK